MMFAFTADDHWEPGIGDPTAVGWVTVVAYFLAAFLCWRAGRSVRANPGSGRERTFWWLFTAVLILLGFNKQLDLQTWLTLFGKHLAQEEGWYERRAIFQTAFIGAVAVGGVLGLAGLRLLVGRGTRAVHCALLGGIFLGCFIVIRASSFHHVDRLLGMDFQGVKMNWLLELGGITAVGTSAFLEMRSARRVRSAGCTDFVWVSAGDRLKRPH